MNIIDNIECIQEVENPFPLLMYKNQIVGYTNKGKVHPIADTPIERLPYTIFKGSHQPADYKWLEIWMENRVFPEDRVDCRTLLDQLGLFRYDIDAICRITQARVETDNFWLMYNYDSNN